MVLRIIFILIITIIVNIFWTFYIKYTYEKKVFLAGLHSLLIQLFSAFVVIEYVNNTYLLIPACIGAFIGVYIVVKYFK
jgi:hypothetical protein